MPRQFTRRDFVKTSALVGATGYFVNPTAAADSASPNERLNIAAIGATGRAGADIAGVATQNIICIADVDKNLLEKGAAKYSQAAKYTDFRVMLEKEADKIDAVVVGTPDHTHAPAAAMAMHMKKHVYCEKPLAHTVFEARTLAELAKKNHLKTQMGTQIHAGENYRQVVELIRAGVIGKVREAHVWVGVDYSSGKLTKRPQPATINWDLWLGPSAERLYVVAEINGKIETIAPFHWRWFWDYGTGGIGDFGCHYMDLVHWALDLRHPTRISASGPPPDPEATSSGLVVKYEYPARGKQPPVKLTWYDGGKQPKQLKRLLAHELKDQNGNKINGGSGQLFVGEQGVIISNYGQHSVLMKDGSTDFKRPEPSIPRSIGHHAEWLNAIKTDGETTCNFGYSGALTESVLLGVASYRSGQTLEWDAAHLKVKNSPAAQHLIHKEYRKGWTL